MATREAARPRNDAYTGLLSISLVALIIGCVLIYMDSASYGDAKPKIQAPAAPRVPENAAPLSVPAAPGAGGAGAAQPGGQPGGAAPGG